MVIPASDDGDRGQVGIGTLIMFIAMVLVAAIAAGVLINTAGTLQSQAEATGDESTAQVSNGFTVFTAVGDVNADDRIDTVELTVGRHPGSGSIDLDGVVVEYIGPDETFRRSVEATDVRDLDGTVLRSGTDRATIVVDDVALDAGDDAQLTLLAPAGAQATAELTVPYEIEDEEYVPL